MDVTSVTASGRNQLLGDMLCLGGALLFAVVSVAQDLVVKTLDWVEYLGMVGLFGSILSTVQTYVLMLRCTGHLFLHRDSASFHSALFGNSCPESAWLFIPHPVHFVDVSPCAISEFLKVKSILKRKRLLFDVIWIKGNSQTLFVESRT